jgi:hypothetical protein
MKVSTENDNNFGYEKITILVDNIPLTLFYRSIHDIKEHNKCRIYVGDQLDRWNELKEVLHVQTHAEVAKILLDR